MLDQVHEMLHLKHAREKPIKSKFEQIESWSNCKSNQKAGANKKSS